MAALWVFLGGGTGSLLRYGVHVAIGLRIGHGFPWSTLSVNVLGSFLLAALMSWPSEALRPEHRLALGTGLMGGFTTYSSFNLETLRLFERGATSTAVTYMVATLVLCLLAGLLGLWLSTRVFE